MKETVTATRRPVSRKAAAAAAKPRRPVALIGLCLVLTAWAAAASWFAWSGRMALIRAADEQAELRASYEEQRKGLLRRLVGVTSHQALEQDGLAGRLADIISRQVELENRQSMLSVMAEKLGFGGGAPSSSPAPAAATASSASSPSAGGRPADPAPAVAVSSSRPAPEPAPRPASAARPEVPTLRLGVPAPPEPPPTSGGLGPRSAIETQPAAAPVVATGRTGVLLTQKDMPLREQFTILEGSIAQIERGQVRVLSGLSAAIHHTVTSIRTALSDLGLNIQLERAVAQPKAAALRVGGRPPPDPFEARYATLSEELGQFERLKPVVDSVPLRKPVEGEGNLTSNFGSRKDPFTGAGAMHAGMDFRGPIGTPIRAAAAGRVVTAGVTGGYGNLVEVEHGNGVLTRYAHLSAFNVAVGQTLTAGTVVGALGSTGRSTGPHLHYETRINGTAVDPLKFLQAGARLFDEPISSGEVTTAGDDAFD